MSRFVTFLALEQFGVVTAEQVIVDFRRLTAGSSMTIDDDEVGPIAPGDPLLLNVRGMQIAVLFVEAPLPRESWEDATENNITWRDSRSTMQSTKGHIAIALLENTNDHVAGVNGAIAVTLVAGALLRRLKVVAAIFSEANSILPAEEFAETVSGLVKGRLPVMFWSSVSFLKGGDASEVAAFSTGLRPFVGRELELMPTPIVPREAAELLIGLSQHLIANGAVVNDNDTVGLKPDQSVRVTFAAEGQRPAVPIMLLRLDTAVASGSPAA